MFLEPPRPELYLSKHFALVKGGAVVYRNVTSKRRTQCEECVWCLHENHGVGPLPRTARTIRERTVLEIKLMMFLCTGHASLWRGLDGK